MWRDTSESSISILPQPYGRSDSYSEPTVGVNLRLSAGRTTPCDPRRPCSNFPAALGLLLYAFSSIPVASHDVCFGQCYRLGEGAVRIPFTGSDLLGCSPSTNEGHPDEGCRYVGDIVEDRKIGGCGRDSRIIASQPHIRLQLSCIALFDLDSGLLQLVKRKERGDRPFLVEAGCSESSLFRSSTRSPSPLHQHAILTSTTAS